MPQRVTTMCFVEKKHKSVPAVLVVEKRRPVTAVVYTSSPRRSYVSEPTRSSYQKVTRTTSLEPRRSVQSHHSHSSHRHSPSTSRTITEKKMKVVY